MASKTSAAAAADPTSPDGFERAAAYKQSPEPERGHVVDPAPEVPMREHRRGRPPLPKEDRKPAKKRNGSYLTLPEYKTVGATKFDSLDEASARRFVLEVLHGREGEAFDGAHPCPKCGAIEVHRFNDAIGRFVCRGKTCRHQFTLFSGTAFHGTSMSVKQFVRVLFEFVEAKDSRSAREFSGAHGMDDQSMRVTLMKIRERLASTMTKEPPLDGFVQVDAAYFMKHVRAGNVGTGAAAKQSSDRKNAGLDENGKVPKSVSPKIHAVVVFVQEGPQKKRKYRVACVKTESQVELLTLAQQFCATTAKVIADQHSAYNPFSGEFEGVYRVNHKVEFATEDGNTTNLAENFHSRMRAAEKGAFHKFTLQNIDLYAWEFAWRLQMVGWDNLYQLNDLIRRVFVRERSERFGDYWRTRKGDDARPLLAADEQGMLVAIDPKDVPKKKGRPSKDVVRPKPPVETKRGGKASAVKPDSEPPEREAA